MLIIKTLLGLIALVAIIWVIAVAINFKPTEADFSRTHEVIGKFTYSSDHRLTSALLNGQEIYLSAGSFGGLTTFEAEKIPNGLIITAEVVDIKTLDGTIAVMTKAKSDGTVYLFNSPSECMRRWRINTTTDSVRNVALIIIGFIFVLVLINRNR